MPETCGFLFPGQGAQFVGMGKDLFQTFPAARKIFTAADTFLSYPLSTLCFEGPEDKLTRTCFAQPAIFITSLAALAVLRDRFPELSPSMVAGLSLGEFTALVAAEAMTFEQGLCLVQKRADAMERCAEKYPGTMASVLGLTQEECEQIARESGCEVANLNAVDQVVLAGAIPAVEKACTLANAWGAKRAVPLRVGGAFHSSLMCDAKEVLENALTQVVLQKPRVAFIPNALAQPVSDVEEIRRLLAIQLTSPVQWAQTMTLTAKLNIPFFLEIGPGKTLKGLAKRALPDKKVEPCGTVSDIQKLEKYFIGI